jgi:[acyl-carrier-protein] S-malonyltransferase
MAAVLGMSSEDTARACADAAAETQNIVSAANFNSPEQTVISGEAPAVERAAALCKERGAKRVVMLQVSAPFHCALMQPAQDRLAELLRATEFSTPRVPVAVNVDAALVTDPGLLREALIRQVTGAVRWLESVKLLIAEGVTFVEVGPGKVLTGLMRQIDRGQTCWNVEDGASLLRTLEGAGFRVQGAAETDQVPGPKA